MNVVKIITNLFAIVFLGFLIYATIQAERYGFAAALGVCFLFVAKMPSIDLFKIKLGKDKSIEAKNEPQD